MKNYKVEVVPGEPAVLLSMYEDYSFVVDDPEADKELIAALDASDEDMFMIIDLLRRPLSLQDVVHSANKDGRGEQALFHHPKVRGLIIVTDSDMVRLATKGLTTVTFGSLNAKAFGSLDEALAYVRSK
jgi:hypothetical protein